MERRTKARRQIGVLSALLSESGKFICFGALEDISAEGAKLRLTKENKLPETFLIVISSKSGPRRKCSLVWQDSDRVGVRFMPVDEAELKQHTSP